MIIPSRRPAPYLDGPVTGILDDIAGYAADEAHWSGTAGRLDSPVEHASAVRELMPWSAKCRPGDARANRRGRRPRGPRGRSKKERTQPSISANGPSRPSSRKTNPRKLWKAQIKSRRHTVAGQLMNGRRCKTYRKRGRWVWRDNKWVPKGEPQAGPRGQRQADQRTGQWASPPPVPSPRPAVNNHAPLPATTSSEPEPNKDEQRNCPRKPAASPPRPAKNRRALPPSDDAAAVEHCSPDTSRADGARRLRAEARPFNPACGVHPDDAAVPPQASPPRFSPLPAPPQAELSSPTLSRTSREDGASSLQADACLFVPAARGPPQASPPQLLLPRAAQSVSAPSRTPREDGATTEYPPLPAQSSPSPSPPRAPRPAKQRNGQGTFLPAVSPPWPAANARGPSPVGTKKRTQPSSSAAGPTSTPSRKADPGQLRAAKSKARRQTVAGQLARGQNPRGDERRTRLRTPAGTPPRRAKGRRSLHLPTVSADSTAVLVNCGGSQRPEPRRGQPELRDLGTDPPQGNPFSVLLDPDDGS